MDHNRKKKKKKEKNNFLIKRKKKKKQRVGEGPLAFVSVRKTPFSFLFQLRSSLKKAASQRVEVKSPFSFLFVS